jgi:hypothetical protein
MYSELLWQRATRARGPGIMGLGLTDLAGPIGPERIMTERLIQDNETPPLSASLKMVVKSATVTAAASVREFKSGCKVCYNLELLQPVVVSIVLTYFTVSSKLLAPKHTSVVRQL